MDVKDIKLDDKVNKEDCSTTEIFFKAPKTLLHKFDVPEFPDAVSSEICVVINNSGNLDDVSVSISPTRYNKSENCYEDYCWCDVDLDNEDKKRLLDLAEIRIGEIKK